MQNKHIKKYSDFLFEQDMMASPGVPIDPTQSSKPKKIKHQFLFMTGPEDSGNYRRVYPDGSVVIEYPAYSIEEEELKKWLASNIISSDKEKLTSSEIDVRKESLLKIVKGDRVNTSNQDLIFIKKLKNAVAANLIAKPTSDVTIVFSKGVPTTDDVDVTFIKYKE